MVESAGKRPPTPAPASAGMATKLSIVLFVTLLALLYQQFQPPPPKICGSLNGPPVTAPRTKLKDGRHLAYLESGVQKMKAKYKVIFVHGFYSCRYDALPISPEVAQELGIYLLSFDRPGYAESDPDPAPSEKSIALDIEELADNLKLGPKFHLIGFSMGGEIMWSCLKYIPHRLSGVAILGPVGNYWWFGLPSNVWRDAWYQQLPQDQWAVWVAHHLPWLTYWWNSQKLFPASSVIARSPLLLCEEDAMLRKKLGLRTYIPMIRQQGDYNSLHRDMMVGFGSVSGTGARWTWRTRSPAAKGRCTCGTVPRIALCRSVYRGTSARGSRGSSTTSFPSPAISSLSTVRRRTPSSSLCYSEISDLQPSSPLSISTFKITLSSGKFSLPVKSL
ncbi:hypothetical protein ACQ4PT_046015 [Festuca glaucescens]